MLLYKNKNKPEITNKLFDTFVKMLKRVLEDDQ